MRELRGDERSYRDIAVARQAEGHRSKRGTVWHPMTVRQILSRLPGRQTAKWSAPGFVESDCWTLMLFSWGGRHGEAGLSGGVPSSRSGAGRVGSQDRGCCCGSRDQYAFLPSHDAVPLDVSRDPPVVLGPKS